VTNFDTPVGIAVRRHCAPVLDLPAHAPPEEYVARRAELGGRRSPAGCCPRRAPGTSASTPASAPRAARPGELAAAGGGTGYEIVRLEALAESVAAGGVEGGEFAAAFGAALDAALARPGAVGVKSVAAYRVGFDFDPRPPSREDVAAAAGRGWTSARAGRWVAAGGPGAGPAPAVGRDRARPADPAARRVRRLRHPDAPVDPALLTDWLHAHRCR
jgi:hypothetical protein